MLTTRSPASPCALVAMPPCLSGPGCKLPPSSSFSSSSSPLPSVLPTLLGSLGAPPCPGELCCVPPAASLPPSFPPFPAPPAAARAGPISCSWSPARIVLSAEALGKPANKQNPNKAAKPETPQRSSLGLCSLQLSSSSSSTFHLPAQGWRGIPWEPVPV